MQKRSHVIVTGGAGFIGSHISRRLLSEGNRVTILDNLSTGELSNIPQEADFIELDLGEQGAYRQLHGIQADAVMHLAGQSSGETSFKDPYYDLRSHVMSTFWLLQWCKEHKVDHFLYASSMSIYGDPQYLPVDEAHPLQPKTYYAAAKVSAESYIKLFQTMGLNTTIFRLFSVYGPGQNLKNKQQGIVSIYLSYMLEGVPVPVKGSTERFRDLVFIDDVVNAWVTACRNPLAFGKIYNLASGNKTKVSHLLDELKSALGVGEYPVAHFDGTPGDQFGVFGNANRVETDLGWRAAVKLHDGLKGMVSYEKAKG